MDDYDNDFENIAQPLENQIFDNDDRVIMPFVPLSDVDSIDENDSGDEDESDNDCDSYDQISLSPPPCMPLLLINLEKLCGYKPSTSEEVENLKEQLLEALVGSASNYEGSYEDEIGDGFSLEFIERSSELFDSEIAIHSDTKESVSLPSITGSCKRIDSKPTEHFDEIMSQITIPYPKFLTVPSQEVANKDSHKSMKLTSRVWKEIMHPHKIAIVDRILKLLSKCSRDLLWKWLMSSEIRHMAKGEQQKKVKQMKKKELEVWRRETRPAELEKLYQVRETFEFRLEQAREQYDKLVLKREVRVQQELQKEKEKGSGSGGVAGLDWDAKVTFAVRNDDKSILSKEELKEDDIVFSDDSYHDMAEDEYEEEEPVDGSLLEVYDTNSSSDEALESKPVKNLTGPLDSISGKAMSTLDRKKRRALASSKRMRRKIESQKHKSNFEEVRNMTIAAHDEEHKMRQLCISLDEKKALATLTNLEDRLIGVDKLLDRLQEEAWEDEEEGHLDEPSNSREDDILSEVNLTHEKEKLSILDQILAMILGSLPATRFISTEEHFKFLKEEHETIVLNWKKDFGYHSVSFPTHELKNGRQEGATKYNQNGQFFDDKTCNDDVQFENSLRICKSGSEMNSYEQSGDYEKVSKPPFMTDTLLSKVTANNIGTLEDNDLNNWDDAGYLEQLIGSASVKKFNQADEAMLGSKSIPLLKLKKSGLRPGGKL